VAHFHTPRNNCVRRRLLTQRPFPGRLVATWTGFATVDRVDLLPPSFIHSRARRHFWSSAFRIDAWIMAHVLHLELTCPVSLQPVPASCLHHACAARASAQLGADHVELLPPCGLITRAMKLAVMDPANRDSELVAHSVSKRTRLGKREVMRIRRRAAAHKTSQPLHELPMVLVAQTDRFTQSTDHPAARSLVGHRRSFPGWCRRPVGRGIRGFCRG